MIKMIVSDLDGTLLTTQKQISSKTRNILIEKKMHGQKIVLASGRTLESVRYAIQDFSLANYIITNNGAAIYDVEKEFFIWQDTFSIETAVKIFELYKKWCQSIHICSSNYYYSYTKDTQLGYNPSIIKVKDFTSLIEKNIPICHISLLGMKPNKIKIVINEIREKFPDLEAFVMQDSFKRTKWIDIMKKGVSKSEMISRLQSLLHIDIENTVLFGDGKNDIEMLQKNGFGIAMANALPEVKSVCKDITDTNDENGIVKWLDKNDV